MGLGLIDGTQAITQLDIARYSYPVVATCGIASGYVGTTTTSAVTIRATSYNPQGVGAQRSISSSSASDSSAGIGARSVTISYLTTGFILKQETVTLNGTTAVNTVNTDIAFIEAMQVATCGSNGGNVGTINIFVSTAGAGGSWGSIAAGDVQTFWAQHYVPSGLTCYLIGIYGGSQTSGTGATLSAALTGIMTINRQQNPLSVILPQLNVAGSFPFAGGEDLTQKFDLAIPIVGPDFIFLTGRPSAAPGVGQTNTVYATFEYVQF